MYNWVSVLGYHTPLRGYEATPVNGSAAGLMFAIRFQCISVPRSTPRPYKCAGLQGFQDDADSPEAHERSPSPPLDAFDPFRSTSWQAFPELQPHSTDDGSPPSPAGPGLPLHKAGC